MIFIVFKVSLSYAHLPSERRQARSHMPRRVEGQVEPRPSDPHRVAVAAGSSLCSEPGRSARRGCG